MVKMEGWIKVHRKFREWEWYQNSNMVHLFIHLLFNANHKDKKWRGIDIRRGQLITGRKILSMETGISEQTIRTCLSRLEKTGELTSKSTNRFSIITISKWDSYQLEFNDTDHQPNQQLTSNQPATNHKQELKKEENDNKLIYRSQNFYEEVYKFKNYPSQMLKEFADYWTEPNKSGRMKFEMEKTWDLKRRLERWSRNSPLKTPVSKKHPEEIRTGRTMTQADIIKHFKEHGKYPGQ